MQYFIIWIGVPQGIIFFSFTGNETENGEEQFSGGAEDTDISHGKLVSNIN